MSGGLRILVIDDEEGFRESLRDEMEESSEEGGVAWKIETQGFEEVEAALLRFRPDMVVLDLIEDHVPNRMDSGIDSGNRAFEQIRTSGSARSSSTRASPREGVSKSIPRSPR